MPMSPKTMKKVFSYHIHLHAYQIYNVILHKYNSRNIDSQFQINLSLLFLPLMAYKLLFGYHFSLLIHLLDYHSSATRQVKLNQEFYAIFAAQHDMKN